MNKPFSTSSVIFGVGFLALTWALSACGLSQLSPSKDADEAVAQIHPQVTAADQAEPVTASMERPEGQDLGSTRSGPGRLRWVRVHAGDTLWSIAARKDIYGSGWYYPLLVHANAQLMPDPTHPRVGARLRVPRDLSRATVEIAEEEAMTGRLLGRRSKPVGRTPTALASRALPAPSLGSRLPLHPLPTIQPSPLPTLRPSLVPTPSSMAAPVAHPFVVPVVPEPAASASSFGTELMLLLLLLLASVAALFWFFRKSGDEKR